MATIHNKRKINELNQNFVWMANYEEVHQKEHQEVHQEEQKHGFPLRRANAIIIDNKKRKMAEEKEEQKEQKLDGKIIQQKRDQVVFLKDALRKTNDIRNKMQALITQLEQELNN